MPSNWHSRGKDKKFKSTFSVFASLFLVSAPAAATEYPVVQVKVVRGHDKLIEAEIVIRSSAGQKSENIKNLPYFVCAKNVAGKHLPADRRTVRDGASVTTLSTKSGIILNVVVETADGNVRTEPETCRNVPVLPVIVSQRFNVPYDSQGMTKELPGGVIVVARLIG